MSNLTYRIEQLERELKDLKREHETYLNKQPKENPNYIDNENSKFEQAIEFSKQTAIKEQNNRDTLKKVIKESIKTAKKEQIKQDELYARKLEYYNESDDKYDNISDDKYDNISDDKYDNKSDDKYDNDSQFEQAIKFSKQTAAKELKTAYNTNKGYIKYYDTKYEKKKLQKKKLKNKCKNIIFVCYRNDDDHTEPRNWY